MLLGINGSTRRARATRVGVSLGRLACGFAGCLAVSAVEAQSPVPQGLSQASLPTPTRPYGADAAGETPQTRLRPIHAPSAVDAIRAQQSTPPAVSGLSRPRPVDAFSASTATAPVIPTVPVAVAAAGYEGWAGYGDAVAYGNSLPVRQAAMMQAPDGSGMTLPSMPPGGYAAPPTYAPPYSPPTMTAPAPTGTTALPPALGSSTTSGPINLPVPDMATTPLPRGNTTPTLPPQVQPSGPIVVTPAPRGPASPTTIPGDYAPLPQPQLTTGFATLGNCRNVSAPSGYQSDRIPTYAPDPASVAQASATGYGGPATVPSAPTVLPPVSVMPLAPGPPGTAVAPTPVSIGGQTIVPGPAKCQPLLSFGQEKYPVQVGQGIFGQPVAYVPGQSFRNCIRYLCW